jgi:hypothetical protein
MKIAAMACFCIILTGMAWPETVTVNAGLPQPPELSSGHVGIAVMLDGKPLKGARADLYRWIRYQDHAGPLCFSGLTNQNGVATPPAIAEGDDHALATVDDVSIFLWPRVIDEGTAMTTLVGFRGCAGCTAGCTAGWTHGPSDTGGDAFRYSVTDNWF